jgi:hypothetical protein
MHRLCSEMTKEEAEDHIAVTHRAHTHSSRIFPHIFPIHKNISDDSYCIAIKYEFP